MKLTPYNAWFWKYSEWENWPQSPLNLSKPMNSNSNEVILMSSRECILKSLIVTYEYSYKLQAKKSFNEFLLLLERSLSFIIVNLVQT